MDLEELRERARSGKLTPPPVDKTGDVYVAGPGITAKALRTFVAEREGELGTHAKFLITDGPITVTRSEDESSVGAMRFEVIEFDDVETVGAVKLGKLGVVC